MDTTAMRSARAVVPLLLELVSPKSVVDVGCGLGAWLRVFRDHGIDDVIGVDGSWIDPARLRIPVNRFISHDLSLAVLLDRTFDLAVSLEVAEHLPPESAAGFVESLVRLAPVVVFSAAVPGQAGQGHLNEQWPDYWSRLFKAHGFIAIDCIRPRIWDNPAVEFWYAQNSFLMVHQDRLEMLDALSTVDQFPPHKMSLVHPVMEAALARDRDSGIVRRTVVNALRRHHTLHALARRLGARGP